jgi:hypothetical protein
MFALRLVFLKKLHDPPHQPTTTPEAKLDHRRHRLPQTRIFWGHYICYRSDQYYSIGHSATEDALCLCVCVCVSLSLPLSLACASERASERAFWLAESAPREKESEALWFCLPQRNFCFSADRGSWLALLTGLVSQSQLTPINYFQYFYIYTLILYFN